LGYKAEEKLHLGVREQERLNTTGLTDPWGGEASVQFMTVQTADREMLSKQPFLRSVSAPKHHQHLVYPCGQELKVNVYPPQKKNNNICYSAL
jgi:hypothetical protein